MTSKRINEPVALASSSTAISEILSFCPGQPLRLLSLTFNCTDSVTNELIWLYRSVNALFSLSSLHGNHKIDNKF